MVDADADADVDEPAPAPAEPDKEGQSEVLEFASREAVEDPTDDAASGLGINTPLSLPPDERETVLAVLANCGKADKSDTLAIAAVAAAGAGMGTETGAIKTGMGGATTL